MLLKRGARPIKKLRSYARLSWRLAYIFVALSPIIIGCSQTAPNPTPPPPTVTVATPVRRTVMEWDEYTGRLEAVEFVEVRARVGGLIVAIPFQEGGLVRAGDLLVEIDVRPYQAELAARQALVSEANARVSLAAIEFKRIDSLPQDVRTATEYDNAAAMLEQAKAQVAAAQAQVEAARLNVEWCRVTAPISGRIGRRLVTPGNLISGGADPGTLLTTIMSIDPIYCYIDADERSILKYAELARAGQRVSARQARIPTFLQLADEAGFPHQGEVDFVDNRVDPATGTIRGRGVFPNSDGWLLPGFFARVRIPGSGKYEALLVPDAAVQTDQSQKLLMSVDDKNVVQPRPVKLGALFGELRAIESGIGPTDRVIINGLMLARPGAKVTPIEGRIEAPESLGDMAPSTTATQPNGISLPTKLPDSQPVATPPAATQPAATTPGGRP